MLFLQILVSGGDCGDCGDLDTASEEVQQSLDFILTHFPSPIFPRTISTYSTHNVQVLIFDKGSILANFEAASYLDCRINAYPDYTSFKEINRTPPSFIMCDLDLKDFHNDIRSLDKALKATLAKIRLKINGHPTVLWTGGGYHVYQPIDGLILDNFDIFAEFITPQLDLTSRFMRFAEAYFTNRKSDPNHNPTVKSSLVRIPNTYNTKYHGESRIVKINQKWDGNRPKINWILRDFRRYLIQEKINIKMEESKPRKYATRAWNCEISWIDKLLEIPIDDYRKNAVNLILAPYLINIKRLTVGEATTIITTWLNKCRSLRHLDPSLNHIVKYALSRSLSFGYKPLRLDSLKFRNRLLYDLVAPT